MVKVLDKGYVELVDVMGDEKKITDIASISYGKTESKNSQKLLERLLKSGHLSPFEQVQFTFKIKCPIFIARQIMRHRVFSFNEQSRRYTKDNWEYYIPELSRLPSDKVNSTQTQKVIKGMYEFQMREYTALIEVGVAPEVARGIMGTGFYTTFFFTGDLRNLLHFLDLRTENHSQFEMREYACAIECLLEKELPNVMKYWREIK